MRDEAGYDLVVVGTGGAAMAAGIEARKRGARVLLVEHGPLGGTCLNVGCVPSKTLVAASDHRHRAQTNSFDGVPTSAGPVDLPAMMRQKQTLVDQMRQAKYADVAAVHGFEILYGHASFTDDDVLSVDGEPLPASAYVIATGADPAVPELSGLREVDFLTSTTAMEQTVLPASMVVIGGGYVGLEQAQLWAHAGVETSLVGRFAPHAEPELAEVLRAAFIADGITVLESRAVAVTRCDGGVRVATEDGRPVSGERLLAAVGRTPRTAGLGLDRAGVDIDARGYIQLDGYQRTTNPKVYAAGDVSSAPQYVYVAARTGHVAAANALGDSQRVDYSGLPAVMFTTPQLARAGLTEQEALAAGFDCDCRIIGADDIPRALANHDSRAALKLVAEAGTGRVLGVSAVFDGAGDVMLAATYAIKCGMTVDSIIDTWAPYLTMGEALRLAAGLFRDDKPTSCCA